jgi:general secretion pathway protein G
MKAHQNHRTHTPRRRRRGFTLLEIIVVVTIIAMLAALVAPRLLRNIGRSRQRIAQAEVASIAQQVQLWMADNGYSRLPDDFDLEMLTEGDDPYLSAKDLLDPWETPYVLISPGEENPADFDVVSYGFDGQPGGDGEDADVALLEVTIVVVIIALLATLIVPRFSGTARREFRLLEEKVVDMLTMFAQREQLGRRPIGLQYDLDRRELMLVVLERGDRSSRENEWLIDQYVKPVRFPRTVSLASVLADGDPVDVVDRPLVVVPGQERPTVTLALQGEQEISTITLSAHAIVPRVTRAGDWSPDSVEPIDLDAAGRHREDW